ncbi:MAG: lysophospholipase L1-like esterase [Candidatus Promineifilaceae bacterium]|jgi:lysophospholipase L1-like esterase
MLSSFAFFFMLLELGYRRVDPYPYFAPWEINRNEFGNLTEYDDHLGWRGTPNAERVFVTQNARVTLRHNAGGHRDVEQAKRSKDLPAIVFLGDSFTWGYDVEYDDMFVNHVRAANPENEIYNFGHRGYGTDQALMIFERNTPQRPLQHVFLMFYENDLADNTQTIRYKKNKPRFLIQNDTLTLTNAPVPHNRQAWKTASATVAKPTPTLKSQARQLLFHSHLLHALHHRFTQSDATQDLSALTPADLPENAWEVTRRLILRIDARAKQLGGKLCVLRIPSKSETLTPDMYAQFHAELSAITQAAGIDYIDLRPPLEATPLRTYYRDGIHWTPRGHQIVAKVIQEYLATETVSKPSP